jgi:sugar lactone lactonase YvrE
MINIQLKTATLLLVLATAGSGQSAERFVTLAGGSFDGGNGRHATTSHLLIPNRVAFLSDGSLLIGDTIGGANIRRMTPDGVLHSFARLNVPQTVLDFAVTSKDVVYVITSNFLFRIEDGKVERIAGTGRAESKGTGGPAKDASISGGVSVALNPAGEVYFSESAAHTIRKINAEGIVELVAGTGVAGNAGDGGAAVAATLNNPQSIRFDAAGTMYVADFSNRRIRAISPDGTITAFAGNPQGPANLSTMSRAGIYFSGPVALDVDSSGRLLVADSGWGRMFRLEGDMFVSLAGGGASSMGFPENVASDKAGLSPIGVAASRDGWLAFTDNIRHMVGRVQDGIVTRIAGRERPNREGMSAIGTLMRPSYVTQDAKGNIYVSEGAHAFVRRITPAGIISTVAGDGVSRTNGDEGPARAASLQSPGPVAVDADGNLYIADNGARRIRKVSATDGIITTVAGTGVSGNTGDGQLATQARIGNLTALAFDASGNLLLLDSSNSVLRRINKDGRIERVAGTGSAGFSGDGGKAKDAQLNGPRAMVVDKEGNIYVADTFNYRIRKISTDGTISHYAGIGIHTDPVIGGVPEASGLGDVMSMAIDEAGTLYFYSRAIDRKPRILAVRDGRLAVFAGTGEYPSGWEDVETPSKPETARMGEPLSMVAGAAGELVFTDTFSLVRRVTAAVKQ